MHSKAIQSLRLWCLVYEIMGNIGGRSKVN